MGTRVDPGGVSIQLYDDHGNPQGEPYFGRFAEFRGEHQDNVVQRTGERTPEERDVPGSQHWLTLVAVADTSERLSAIVQSVSTPTGDLHTSHSSRRVLVELHVKDRRETFAGRVTIASGPIVSVVPPVINVVHVKVLGAGTVLTDTHPLRKEFDGGTPFPLFRDPASPKKSSGS